MQHLLLHGSLQGMSCRADECLVCLELKLINYYMHA